MPDKLIYLYKTGKLVERPGDKPIPIWSGIDEDGDTWECMILFLQHGPAWAMPGGGHTLESMGARIREPFDRLPDLPKQLDGK